EPGVIPRTRRFTRFCFLTKIDKLKVVVKKNSAAFAHVLTTGHADQRLNAVVKINNAFVILGRDQNVAVSENKRRVVHEIPRKIDHAAGAILRHLSRVLDVDLVTRPVAEKILHGLGAITNDDEKSPNT